MTPKWISRIASVTLGTTSTRRLACQLKLGSTPSLWDIKRAGILSGLRFTGGLRVLPVLAPLMLGGCMVGPNYTAPELKLSARYHELPVESSAAVADKDSSADEETSWWKNFNDPELSSLVEQAIIANNNIAVASARVQEARAARQIAQSFLYPQVGIGASVLRFKASEAGLGLLSGPLKLEDSLFQVGFDAAWAIDLFGGIRRTIEAAQAGEEAVAFMRRGVVLTIAAETARAYLELRGMQRELQVARDTLRDQKKTLTVTEIKHKSGLSSDLELLRAKTEVEVTAAQIHPIEQSIRQYIHVLSTLLGQEPASLSSRLEIPAPIPKVPDQIAVGIPSELLRRRPDIQAAERKLAGLTAQVGIATAQLFPQLVLGGSAGAMSRDSGDIFNLSASQSSGYYLSGPFINWTLFDGGRRQAGIRLSEAQVEAAKAEYQEAVLRAFREVESSLVAVNQSRKQVIDLKNLSVDANKSAAIARADYEQGILDQLTVLDAQRQANRADMLLTQGQMALVVNVTALYKALGGGWEIAEEKLPQKADGQGGSANAQGGPTQ